MPRLVNQNPSYRYHKASGQPIVTLNGEDIYLGAFGSKQSRREYDRVIGEWLANGRQRAGLGVNVADVIKAYWDFAQKYYRLATGVSRTASRARCRSSAVPTGRRREEISDRSRSK